MARSTLALTPRVDNVDDVMAEHINTLQTNQEEIWNTLSFVEATELDISAVGAITVTQNYHTVDTDGDIASDNLDTITISGNIEEGTILILRPDNDARTVVVRHNQGNIMCNGNANITLDDSHDFAFLVYDETLVKWMCFSGGTGVAADIIWDAKGDLAGGTGADTAQKLTVGANDTVLTADNGETTGMKWAAASGGGFPANEYWGNNLMKNYPSLESADGAQPQWWEITNDEVLTEEDATGEGIPQKHERVLKLVISADGGDADYVYEDFDDANEPTLDDNVTKVSAGCWVYTADAGTVTLELYDVDGVSSLGTDTTIVTSTWTWLEVLDKTYQDSMRWRVTHSANNATVYIAMPCLNVGAIVRPWAERKTHYRYNPVSDIYSGNPADANWHDLDFTANSSPLAVAINVSSSCKSGTLGRIGYIRPNGSAVDVASLVICTTISATLENYVAAVYCLCDDEQICEHKVNNADVTKLAIGMRGYWEWDS